MTERYRSRTDVVGVLQRRIDELHKRVNTVASRDRSIPDQLDIGSGLTDVPNFTNGWGTFQGRTVGIWRDNGGVVRLGGTAGGGIIGQSMFQIAQGYRPSIIRGFAVVSNNAFGYVEVDPNGSVICWVGSSSWVTLDGISFRAEL